MAVVMAMAMDCGCGNAFVLHESSGHSQEALTIKNVEAEVKLGSDFLKERVIVDTMYLQSRCEHMDMLTYVPTYDMLTYI